MLTEREELSRSFFVLCSIQICSMKINQFLRGLNYSVINGTILAALLCVLKYETEMTERFYKHFKSKLTSKRLAQVLSGLGPYIASGELTLNELVARPKFFKAAYMLGAKYVPQRHGK